jgi:hypothetical protein
MVTANETYFAEPGRKWQCLISSQRPNLAGASGKGIERRADAEDQGNGRHCNGSSSAICASQEDLFGDR